MFLFITLACTPPLGEWARVGLPAHAPAATLLATLEADNSVEIGGTSLGELWVDTDGGEDERYAFRYVVEDARGSALYARSTPGPLIVREFLAYYTDTAGFDILGALPQLGNFPITVPLLDGAAHVRMQLRDDDGAYQDVGTYDLDQLEPDDLGPLDAVVGSETLHDAGPSEDRLDIVVMGDGYTADQQAEWRADADTLTDAILGIEPLLGLSERINVHRVDTVSAESGVSYDCVDECRIRDTALQTIFPIEIANSALGLDFRTTAVFQLDQWGVARAAATFPWDMVVIVANTTHDGGFAVHYATVPKGTDDTWPATGVHELGHSLGLLGDEYMSDACVRSEALGLPDNITDDASAPPWAAWIEADTPLPTPDDGEWDDAVGAWEGAWNCDDLYRPARTCRMKGSGHPEFCSVCAELLTRRVYRYGDPAEDVTVSGSTFTVEGKVDGATVSWWVDGLQSGETGDTLVADTARAVEARVTFQTEWVREDGGDLTEVWRFER